MHRHDSPPAQRHPHAVRASACRPSPSTFILLRYTHQMRARWSFGTRLRCSPRVAATGAVGPKYSLSYHPDDQWLSIQWTCQGEAHAAGRRLLRRHGASGRLGSSSRLLSTRPLAKARRSTLLSWRCCSGLACPPHSPPPRRGLLRIPACLHGPVSETSAPTHHPRFLSRAGWLSLFRCY